MKKDGLSPIDSNSPHLHLYTGRRSDRVCDAVATIQKTAIVRESARARRVIWLNGLERCCDES